VTASNSGLLPNPREPLHVGMLVASDYASDGRVRRQAEALVERGDEVTVLALKAQGREDIEMIEGVRVVHLPVSKYRGESSGAYIKLYGSFALHSGLRLARWPRRFWPRPRWTAAVFTRTSGRRWTARSTPRFRLSSSPA